MAVPAAARTAAGEAFRACLCSLTDVLIRIVACVLLMGGAALCASPAAAQSEPQIDGVALSLYVAGADYQSRLKAYIVGYETWIGPCPNPEPVERINILLPQSSVPLPGDPDPGAPQWVEQVRITGCEAPYERFVYVSMKGAKPIFHARLLGSSQTSPRLEEEAVAAVIEKEHATAVANGCPETQPVRVFTATYTDRFEGEYGVGWREKWQIADCRGTRDIAITFTPDHTGGTRIDFAAAAD